MGYTFNPFTGTLDNTGTASGGGTSAQTMYISAAAMLPQPTLGCAPLATVEVSSSVPYVQSLDFDGAAVEYAIFEAALPSTWDLGTITFSAYWTSTATDTDGVAWGLQAVCLGDNVAIGTAYGTGVLVTDNAQSTANNLYVSGESAEITVGGTPADNKMTYFRVYRAVADAADTMTEDAKIIGIRITLRA